ncbi:MAG: isoprenylcysteine carboxylmethyltransferase family protein [Candidatus Eremiobacteraeota bacterium]|nr:isoprenylcysteine carboxylmethyltransferase family protein [Candidatus Eremiobacteraeota bacterium]
MIGKSAPWFFRKRATLFGVMYGLSFFLGFLIAGLMNTSQRPFFASFAHIELSAVVVLAFTFGGYALRLWASSYLPGSIVWQQDIQIGDLRESGPYRFTRNPLYLGNFLQAIGIGMLGTWQVLALLVISMLAYQYAIISVEERFLIATRDQEYSCYLARVQKFFPAPWKVAPGTGQRASLSDGFRSELGTAGFAILSLVLLIVLWPR